MLDKPKAEDFELKEENKEDVKASVIERHNIVTEFTVADVEDHKKDLQKMQTELNAQIKVCQATLDNIDRNHAFIADLSEEQMHHVWMYQENVSLKENSASKLEQVNEQIEAYQNIIDIVHDKFWPLGVTEEVDDES